MVVSELYAWQFNLYCNGTPSVYDYEDAEKQLSECSCYTVEDLFLLWVCKILLGGNKDTLSGVLLLKMIGGQKC
mgnify:CR=1 FL=1